MDLFLCIALLALVVAVICGAIGWRLCRKEATQNLAAVRQRQAPPQSHHGLTGWQPSPLPPRRSPPPPAAPVGGGRRECARRRRQIKRGVLQCSPVE